MSILDALPSVFSTTPFSGFANIATILLLIVSIIMWSWLKYRSWVDNKQINIHLKADTGEEYNLFARIRRKNLTRSEVQGLLGVIPMLGDKQPRYNPSLIAKADFFQSLEKAQSGKSNTLTINCTSEELNQFDLSKLQKIN